jgi:hypothetical protein
MATPDIYFVYVTSSYQGQSASNFTTFLIGHGPRHKVGDLGTGYPLVFGKFDGKVDGRDLALFLMCYKGTAPPDAMYLGDLGTGYPLVFFAYDGKVDGKDLAMFLMCYKGLGPTGPVAIFTWDPLEPIINQPVTFNASESYDDKYGTIANYTWDFGDGNTTTVTNPMVLYTFTSSGNYTVTLTVKDNNLQTDSTSHIISIYS